MKHDLKIWPQYFHALKMGYKKLELRWNDRDYNKGDELHLNEYDPETQKYSGLKVICRVTHILKKAPGLEEGYVLMSIKPLFWDENE